MSLKSEIIIRRITLATIVVLAMSTVSYGQEANEKKDAVSINTSFPGGNAKVTAMSGNMVHLEPDLRGGRPWFYWYFEAKSTQPGKVTFVFPEKVAGFKNGAIGFQGPAISNDQGNSWKWMGTDQVKGDSFFYEFAKANESVRFAVTIPYVQSNLDEFLKKHVLYFVGPKEHPAYNFQNVSEFAGWIKKGLPKDAPVGPYVWLRPAETPTPMNSHYFGFKEGTIMAATLEIPFAPPGKATDPTSCRGYGQVILGAWVNTHFLAPD